MSILTALAGFGTALGNVSKWWTPKEVREKKLAQLIKERDVLLDTQSTWGPGDSEKLTRITRDIRNTQRLLDQAGS